MEHPRQIIRQTIVEMITAGATLAGNRIFDSRDFTLSTNATPAIIIRTTNERLEDSEQQDFGLRRRVMTVSIECYHTGDGGAIAVDEMAWQVENIIHADPVLKNKVEWCRLLDTTIDFADDGSMALYVAALNFEVIYCTHLYEKGGEPPVTILIGFDPDTGVGNEDHYVGEDDLTEVSDV